MQYSIDQNNNYRYNYRYFQYFSGMNEKINLLKSKSKLCLIHIKDVK